MRYHTCTRKDLPRPMTSPANPFPLPVLASREFVTFQCNVALASYDRQIAEVSNAGGISSIHAVNPMATGHRLQVPLPKAQGCENHAGLTAVPSVPRAAPLKDTRETRVR